MGDDKSICLNLPKKRSEVEEGGDVEKGPKPPNQLKSLKKSKRERKRGDPTLLLNISHLLELAKLKIYDARSTIPPPPQNSSAISKPTVYNWRFIRQSQSLIKDLRELAKKAVFRLPREMKRQFCKKCNVYLLSGVTAECRVLRADGYKFLRIKCTLCKKFKKYILKRGVKSKKTKKRKKAKLSAPSQDLPGDQ
jgi:RNase P subunit RPR2